MLGFYHADTGATELLGKLTATSQQGASSGPFEYLGDSRRENRLDAQADPVEFKGIRLQDWVIGSNKTHITPIEIVDRYVAVLLRYRRPLC